MWQSIITGLIVFIALLFIGRKVYRQFRGAMDPSQNITCGCSGGCSGCNSDDCSTRNK